MESGTEYIRNGPKKRQPNWLTGYKIKKARLAATANLAFLLLEQAPKTYLKITTYPFFICPSPRSSK